MVILLVYWLALMMDDLLPMLVMMLVILKETPLDYRLDYLKEKM